MWLKRQSSKSIEKRGTEGEKPPPEQEEEARIGANNKNSRESLEHGDPLGRGLETVPFQPHKLEHLVRKEIHF